MIMSKLSSLLAVQASAQYFNPSAYYAPPAYSEFAPPASLPAYSEYAPQGSAQMYVQPQPPVYAEGSPQMYMQPQPPVYAEGSAQMYAQPQPPGYGEFSHPVYNFAPPVYNDYLMQQPLEIQPAMQEYAHVPQPAPPKENIPDPQSVEAEKRKYLAKAADNLKEQVEAATKKNNEEKDTIIRAAEEQKKQYIESSDQRLKQAVKDSDDQLAARVKSLTQSADDYKKRLDGQSQNLAMQYCQRTLKDEFDKAEAVIATKEQANKRELEDELRLAQEVARTASQAMGERYGDSAWFPETVARAQKTFSEHGANVRQARESNLEQYRSSLTECARKSRADAVTVVTSRIVTTLLVDGVEKSEVPEKVEKTVDLKVEETHATVVKEIVTVVEEIVTAVEETVEVTKGTDEVSEKKTVATEKKLAPEKKLTTQEKKTTEKK